MFKGLIGFLLGGLVFTEQGNKLCKAYFAQLKKEMGNWLPKECNDDNGKTL